MIFRRFLLIITGLLFFTAISAQDGTVKGFVYDEDNGEPIIFTTVFLKGTSYGASTDQNGYFSITKIPPGEYTLIGTYIGYDTAQVNVTIEEGSVITQKLFISESSVELQTFNVSAEKQEFKTEVKMSVSKVTPKEIKSIPSIGGEPDLAQYLQVLPGVIFTGDQGGKLYIRGGSPIQNKVLMDGMVIYNPFHSIGLFSVFDTDIIRNADIYTGGFNAEYGGRISSIMDITTKDGNKKRFGGKVSASTFGAKALLEGPIKKAEKLGGNSSSFIFSTKHSYLDESSKLFYNYIDSAGLPYTFTDLYGKISLNAENGSKVNFFGFNHNDQVDYPGVSSLGWDAFGGGTNFILIPGQSKTLIEGVFAYSSYEVSLTEEDQKPRTSSISGFNMGMDFTSFSGDNQAKYGFEALGFNTDFEFFNAVDRKIEQEQNTTELAGYFKYRINKGDFVFEPSFRLHYYASLNNISPEPRLGIKYNVNDDIRLKAATGMYSQNLISATSDRDVVNLFYGFLSGPDNLQDEFTTKDGETREVNHKLQKANHYIFGVEYDIFKNATINVEGYYKQFTQLTNINRDKLFEDNADNIDKPDRLKKDFIIETGDAYGVDFVFNYNYRRINLYAVYSLSKVTRWDGEKEYSPIFDRRHNVNFVGSYIFGEDRNWEVNARWNLGSGFPFTQTLGFYEDLDFQESIGQNYTSANGDLGIQYATLNGGRLPYYHRLDISLKRTFVLGKNSILEANFSITNVYDRENIFYFNRVSYERVNQLPIMPSLGANLTF